MPQFVGRLRSPQLTAAPSSPVKGEMYMNTTTNKLQWWDGTVWVDAAAAVGSTPTRVTSLPGSPVDGQEVYYVADATEGAIWHLRYFAAGTYGTRKWEFLGGAPMMVRSATDVLTSFTNSAYTTDATPIHQITLPLGGDYIIRYGAAFFDNVGADFSYMCAHYYNGSVWGAMPGGELQFYGQSGNNAGPIAMELRAPAYDFTAGFIIRALVKTGGIGTGRAKNRWLSVTPVRVS